MQFYFHGGFYQCQTQPSYDCWCQALTLFAWGDVQVAAQLKFVDESDSVKRSD